MLRRFHGSAKIDATRLSRDVDLIASSVVQHLAGLLDAKVTITVEIEAEIPSGAPDNVVRTVTENCRTLKFENQDSRRAERLASMWRAPIDGILLTILNQ